MATFGEGGKRYMILLDSGYVVHPLRKTAGAGAGAKALASNKVESGRKL